MTATCEPAGVAIRAIESVMSHLPEKCSYERNVADFDFGDKTVGYAKTHHQGQHVKIASVVSGINFRAGRIHEFFADDADLRPRQSE